MHILQAKCMHIYESTEKNSTTRHSFEDHTTTTSKMHTYVWKLAEKISTTTIFNFGR
jgi:hypothetical protein